jgi:hypothetical protein
VTGTSLTPVDARKIADLASELRRAGCGYLPRWNPADGEPDGALVEIAARYLYAIVQRLNQAPQKNRLAFLDALGVQLLPAQAARVPIVFRLGDRAGSVRAPAGTRVAAPPPVDSTQQLVFETERNIDLTAGKLTQVVSLWPGRDQYIDHTKAVVAKDSFVPWELRQLEDIPHHLYLRHDTLLALKGEVRLLLHVELTTAGTVPMEVIWEYWDGSDWRGFDHAHRGCGDTADFEDGTDGLRQSGTYLLTSDCAESQPTDVHRVTGSWVRGRLQGTVPPEPARILPDVDQIGIETEVSRPLEYRTNLKDPTRPPGPVTVTRIVSGLLPESAVAGVLKVDSTKPFQPFGPVPQPGAILNIKSDEAFATPDAEVHLLIVWERFPPTILPKDVRSPGVALAASHGDATWEYWNGRLWVPLLPTKTSGDDLFETTSLNTNPDPRFWTELTFLVPADLASTTVNDEEGLWIRLRMTGGAYAALFEVSSDPREFVVLPFPPVITHLRLGYRWRQGPFLPETVLTYNDFQFVDRTVEARVPGPSFKPYTPSDDLTPALYLGFDKPPPPGRIGLLFDVVEDPADTDGPLLRFEYFDGAVWKKLVADDGTRRLRVPGIASLLTESDDRPGVRFDTPLAPLSLNWVRARLAEDGPPGAPKLNAIYPNAVWAVQHQTVVDEPLGRSTGVANQTLVFRQVPVLRETTVAVREVAGRRANVEWRQIALEVYAGDARQFQALEDQLLAEGPSSDVEYGRVLLRRDRLKQVIEVWVTWAEKATLFLSAAGDRDYVVDRARGRLTFGDGEHGKVPPPGAAVLARRYQAGGGRAGNTAVKTIAQLLGPIGGVESVENPLPAQGGADGEPVADLAERGPATLRHRGRAVTPGDYEAIAYEAAPDLGWVRAVPCLDRGGHARPGWITLLVVPDEDGPQPWPSFGLRENIRRYVEDRAGADVTAADQVVVTGPDYFPVDVEATLVAGDPAESGTVATRAREALERFFSPVRGGPNGRGWDLGRDVFLSDVAAVLEHVEGLDYVEELALFANGVRLGERVEVPPRRVVVVGDLRLFVGEAT